MSAPTHVVSPWALHQAFQTAAQRKVDPPHRLHRATMERLDRWVNHEVIEFEPDELGGIDALVNLHLISAHAPSGPRITSQVTVTLPAAQQVKGRAQPVAGWIPQRHAIRPVPIEEARRPDIWRFHLLDDRRILTDCSLWPRWPHLFVRAPGRMQLGGEKVGRVRAAKKPKGARYRVSHGLGKEDFSTVDEMLEAGWRVRHDHPANEPRRAFDADYPPPLCDVEFEGDPRMLQAPTYGAEAGRRQIADHWRGMT